MLIGKNGLGGGGGEGKCRRILDARVHIFSYQAAILDLATVEDWGE